MDNDFRLIRNRIALIGALVLVAAFGSARLIAQDQGAGPMAPAASADSPIVPKYAPEPTPSAPAAKSEAAKTDSPISKDQPPIPVDQIIKTFAEHESEFKIERNNFDYTQDLDVQTVDDDGKVDGEMELTSDITYSHDGKQQEYVTYAPASTLERITMEQEDYDDLKNITPFVLTTEDLPKYNVTYVGRQQLDKLGTYIFDVAPKTIVKGQRYFQGRIWVEDQDLEIVKTNGKAVPNDLKRGSLYPSFEMYRDNIEGHFWFPVYAHADETLQFKENPVRIRETVRWTNYKRFRVSSRIVPNAQPVDKK